MATGKAKAGSIETAAIVGSGVNQAITVNNNYLPFTDAVNYLSANSHVLRNLGGTLVYAVVDANGITTTFGYTLVERAEPAAPDANNCVIYARDSGGKTQLCVRFPTGAVQVIATEP